MSNGYSIGSLLTFLRRPYFPAGRDPVGEPQLRHITQLLFLSLAIVLFLSGLAGSVIQVVMGELPENANADLGEESPAMLLFYGVILMPIIEEVIFRSWLGGKRACLLGLPILVSVFAVGAAILSDTSPILSFAIAGGLGFLILGIAQQYSLLPPKAQKAARWRLFPAAFYGSAILFALLHLSNYEGGLSSPVLLLAVLPQGLVGLVLGYIRLRFGLLQAILFHAVYNLILIGLFLVSQAVSVSVEATARLAFPLL